MKESNIAKMLDETIDETDSESQLFHVFLLVNSMSGSRSGRELIKKFSEPISIKHENNATKIYVFDLYVQEQVSSCFFKINKLCQENVNPRLIACGGDGTIQWVLSESIAHKIDFSKAIFSTIPIGTGNDFATSIGWNKHKFSVSEKGLQSLAIKLSKCQISKYDVWDCQIETHSSGKITQIKNGIETELNVKTLKKSFTNYCGIGSDARISYFAQRINASSVFMKKFMYGIAGIWSFFTSDKKLQKSISRFHQSGEKLDSYHLENELTQKPISVDQSALDKNIKIFPTDSCLTFLNSTSSMEIQKIWETPYSTNSQKIYKAQKVDDGLIEIVGYRNELSIALERRIHMATKVSQGEGPFRMFFKEGEKEESIYVHINGEPYKIENLQSLVISKNVDIRDSQIKVLKFLK